MVLEVWPLISQVFPSGAATIFIFNPIDLILRTTSQSYLEPSMMAALHHIKDVSPVEVVSEPEVPYSIFSSRSRTSLIATVSVAATFSGIFSNKYHPAIPLLAKDLATTPAMINLTVTAYLIF
ncbi:hypothetical protein BJ878DRAFT_200046 [Calycina marina]|uniref:Uncharacterized protein n=1 Tax=Calycina marina TaxID=1763456 RepID=A0A9P7ZBG9_9HELO|nr:hypothetical protein BJ878DRAFT_200046 [Calycina marina]